MNDSRENNNNQPDLISAIIKAVAIAAVIYFSIFGFDIVEFNKKFNNDQTVNNQTEKNNDEADIYEEEDDEVVYDDSQEEEVFYIVEEMPIYKGCDGLNGDELSECTMRKIQRYIAKVDYPMIAQDNDITGKVWVSFIVDTDGSVVDVQIIRSADPLLDKAAKKHIQKMPKFLSAGKQRGKAVKIMYKIPISFRLE